MHIKQVKILRKVQQFIQYNTHQCWLLSGPWSVSYLNFIRLHFQISLFLKQVFRDYNETNRKSCSVDIIMTMIQLASQPYQMSFYVPFVETKKI